MVQLNFNNNRHTKLEVTGSATQLWNKSQDVGSADLGTAPEM